MVYAGVDLGATRTRAVVGDAGGTILGRAERPTPRGPSGIAVTEAVLSTLREACEAADRIPGDVRAVGIGSIGPLDLAAGGIDHPANLPDEVDHVPLRGPVQELVGSGRVYLHNDTTAGVIGERYYSDRTPDDMVYLTMSSGIGAGVAVDGNVLRGWDGNAGEVGHYVVDPAGRLTCGCGREGHWEAYCSGQGIPAFARLLADENPDLAARGSLDPGTADAPDVFDAAERGDPFAEFVLDRVADLNVVGVTNLVHSFAPLVVYVGGAVALNHPDRVLDPVRRRIGGTVMTNVPEIRPTSLGEDAVLRGALASAITGTTGTGERPR